MTNEQRQNGGYQIDEITYTKIGEGGYSKCIHVGTKGGEKGVG